MGKSDDSARQLFILLADDEPSIRYTIVEILRSEGYDAVAVEDGKKAVEYARKAPPDIFLADLAMPGMNGIEAAKQIKALCPKTRVICFSGHGTSSEWLAKAKKDGYDFELLAKPIRPEALIRAIRGAARLNFLNGTRLYRVLELVLPVDTNSFVGFFSSVRFGLRGGG